jgi:hypothetical protein
MRPLRRVINQITLNTKNTISQIIKIRKTPIPVPTVVAALQVLVERLPLHLTLLLLAMPVPIQTAQMMVQTQIVQVIFRQWRIR